MSLGYFPVNINPINTDSDEIIGYIGYSTDENGMKQIMKQSIEKLKFDINTGLLIEIPEKKQLYLYKSILQLWPNCTRLILITNQLIESIDNFCCRRLYGNRLKLFSFTIKINCRQQISKKTELFHSCLLLFVILISNNNPVLIDKNSVFSLNLFCFLK